MKKQVVLSFEEFEELENYKKNYEENKIIVSYFSWNEKEILPSVTVNYCTGYQFEEQLRYKIMEISVENKKLLEENILLKQQLKKNKSIFRRNK
jgi:hypothetical protein